jgi:hypothetical protein
MKACTIYKTKNKFIIVCMHETDAKFYRMGEPLVVLESWNDSTDVGTAVLNVLNSSREGVPASSARTNIVPAILKAGKAASWRKFEAQTTECLAQMSGSIIELTPAARVGDDSSVHLTDRAEKTTTQPADLGDALLKILAQDPSSS